MSRTAVSTPPPPFFPQRNTTQIPRQISTPSLTPSHFTRQQANHFRRKAKQAFKGRSMEQDEEVTPTKPVAFEPAFTVDQSSLSVSVANDTPESSIFRTQSVASVSTSASFDSSMTGQSLANSTSDASSRRWSFAPSMCTSASSFVITPLATPASSRAPSLIQTDFSGDSSLSSPIESISLDAPAFDNHAAKGSWVPNLGKMAKAVVHHGMNMSPFGEKRSKKSSQTATPPPPVAQIVKMVSAPVIEPDYSIFEPSARIPQPSREELLRLDEETAMARRREWALEQQKRVQECARLCSQWPQSGYNQMKWGPYGMLWHIVERTSTDVPIPGSKHFYEPQSYCNPQHVATVMQRQAELERKMCDDSALFFSCRRNKSPSADSSNAPSPSNYASAQSSPRLSADLSAAMSSSLLSSSSSGPQSITVTGKRSLSDLKSLSMDMDIDAPPENPSHSACGLKRPLTSATAEDDKRRKVDEAMVVEEAVETGVIQPPQPAAPPATLGTRQLSASTPNLHSNQSNSPAMFGHVVKTSDTHPIIISPFLPQELVPIISKNVSIPATNFNLPASAPAPTVLTSSIDVPSLLLSFVPPQIQSQASENGLPMNIDELPQNQMSADGSQIGNLLLSSCPGKRLRMEGPIKGRGPVCRDLETDLRRIKSEGVGCLAW